MPDISSMHIILSKRSLPMYMVNVKAQVFTLIENAAKL